MSSSDSPRPARWERVRKEARSPEEAARRIGEIFSPHELTVVGRGELDVRLDARMSEEITIAELEHGTAVSIRPGRLGTYYEINVPLTGSVVSRYGLEELTSSPGLAAVLGPNVESAMEWSDRCRQLAVKIRRSVLDRTLSAYLGRPLDDAATFDLGFSVDSGPGHDWLQAVLLLRDAVDRGAPDLVLRPLEELVVAQFLAAQSSNYSERLHGDVRVPRPRTVRVVLELIDARNADPLTVSDMATVAGVSVRALQLAFAEHLGVSPMEHLRRVRLYRARQDLIEAVPGDGQTVADIAFRHGLGHLPRFAKAYRALYGESPSDTLRR